MPNVIEDIDETMFLSDNCYEDVYFVDTYEYESAVFGEVACLLDQ